MMATASNVPFVAAPPYPQHFRYQHYHYGPPQNPPPPQNGCSFCARANNRRDDFGLTHRVKDRDGNITCPFLKINTCTRCYKQGHTAMHCQNPSVDQELLCDSMQQMQMCTAAPSRKQIEETDEQTLQRKLQETEQEIHLFRLRVLKSDFLTPKECSFCKNGKFEDEYYKTHFVTHCPRLACTRCPYCKQYGHTLRYCKLRQHNEALRAGVPPPRDSRDDPDSPPLSTSSIKFESSFVFDFDKEEICDTASSSMAID